MRLNLNEGADLQYRLVVGSTVRWVVRMDIDMSVSSPGDAAETMQAMVTSAIDCEIVRIEGQTALVRPIAHRSDFWVRGGTLTEDDVADPMAGFIKAFLLDDLGSVVPLVDERASALAPPDDANPGRALLLSLFPPYAGQAVTPGRQWEVELHHSWSAATDTPVVQVALARLEQGSDGRMIPVLLHGLEYDWANEADGSQDYAAKGQVRFAAETRVDPADGWALHTEGKCEISAHFERDDGVARSVTTRIRLVADRE